MVTWDIQKDKRTKHGEEFKSERMRVREREREREIWQNSPRQFNPLTKTQS